MISSLTQESWDGKVIELGGSILQSWVWGQFQKSLGQKIYRFSGDDFVCLAIETILPAGKKYLYCPRGPLGNAEAALIDLKKFETDHSVIFSRLEPNQKMDLPEAAKETQPKDNWMVSLEKTDEELLVGMKPKTRYNINLASRKGVTVREGSQADLLAFYKLMLETAARNHYRLHSQNYYFQMWDHLAPKNLKLLVAEYQGQILAGVLLSIFGGTATYLHGGSSQRMKEAMVPYLLHFEGMKLARSLGGKLYDFGGVSVSDDSRHSWAGISRFKKGFGGFLVSYPGAFDLIYSPIWYNVYREGRRLNRILRNK